ncbi:MULTISPECIES: hypothetical protein [unclassified Serratia (in: enterobacteria)]
MQKKIRTEAGIVKQVSASHHAKPTPKKHSTRSFTLFSDLNGHPDAPAAA